MAQIPSRLAQTFRSQASVQWACLLVASAVFVAVLEALHLPAALLLGPMIAGIVVGTSGGHIRVNEIVFSGTQAIIGCMIGRSIPVSILHEAWVEWPVFVVGVMSTIVMAAVLGWSLAHWRVLPGTSAIWGSTPGGAAAMVVMLKIKKVVFESPGSSQPYQTARHLAVWSLVLWVAAITAGRFLAYTYTYLIYPFDEASAIFLSFKGRV